MQLIITEKNFYFCRSIINCCVLLLLNKLKTPRKFGEIDQEQKSVFSTSFHKHLRSILERILCSMSYFSFTPLKSADSNWALKKKLIM